MEEERKTSSSSGLDLERVNINMIAAFSTASANAPPSCNLTYTPTAGDIVLLCREEFGLGM